MNKKLIYSAAAIALLGASCSQDDMPQIGQEGMTTLSVSIPGDLATRYGEAKTTPSLYVAIYKQGTKEVLFSNFSETTTNGMVVGEFSPTGTDNMQTANVQVPLVKGMAYDIVCWAQNKNVTAYSFDASTQTITVTYGTGNTIDNYAENRDAFYGQSKNFISGGQGDNITLTRPFAQINVGTSDWSAYTAAGGNAGTAFGMTIEGVANTLNLLSGEITAPRTATTVTVSGAATSEEHDAFPVAGNTYLAMAYVLANQNLTVGLTGMGDGYNAWRNVPAQANYRTNIFGTLLTNTENFTITLDPNWAGTNNVDPNVNVWGGDATEAQLNELIAKGGNIKITKPVAEIDLTNYAAAKPLTLLLDAQVSKMYVKDFAANQLLTIKIGSGVTLPAFGNKTHTGRNGGPSPATNITIEGDLKSTTPCGQLDLTSMGSEIENVTIRNIHFDGDAIGEVTTTPPHVNNSAIMQDRYPMQNVTIENCVFTNMKFIAIYITKNVRTSFGPTEHYDFSPNDNITIRNCNITIADDADSNSNGIYLLQTKNMVIEDCTVTNAKYHGIFARAFETAKITGNTIENAGHDGIKVESQIKDTNNNDYVVTPLSYIVTDNNVKAAENGIRIQAADNFVDNLTLTGNTIEKINDDAYGIILKAAKQTNEPVITVLNNIQVGAGYTKWFSIQGFTPASGSNYSAPYKN